MYEMFYFGFFLGLLLGISVMLFPLAFRRTIIRRNYGEPIYFGEPNKNTRMPYKKPHLRVIKPEDEKKI